MCSEAESVSNSFSSESDRESCSESSEHSKLEFLPYDEDVEPLATEQEAAEYADQVAREEQEYRRRYTGETDVNMWCKCSQCSIEGVTKAEECMCCMEIDRCNETMEAVGKQNECITLHPGFRDVCLNRWVLEIAALGLKTKAKATKLCLIMGSRLRQSFYDQCRRQLVRLIWENVGSSRRFPLPCCTYNVIRAEFPSENGEYHGFEDDED